MHSAYICVIFQVKDKKSPFLAVLTGFLILGKIQDGGQDGDHCFIDVKGLKQRHHPENIPHVDKKSKGFPRKAKTFRNTATYQQLIPPPPPPPPPPLYHGGGMNLRVGPRVKD